MKRLLSRLCLALVLTLAHFDLPAQSETPEIPQPPSTGFTVSRATGVNISGPTTICKGGETILKAEGDFESFEWNTGSSDRLIRVKEEGTYEVTATTKGGCRLSTSVTVRVVPCT